MRCRNSETFHRDPEGSTPSRQRSASQPEASLAWVVATSFVKRRQQVLKPRGSPDMTTLKPLLSKGQGQHRRDRHWRGFVGSAGVLDRGKGTGWIVWEPERSRSRPRESAPAMGSPAEQRSWPEAAPLSARERWHQRARTKEESRGPRKRTK